MAGGEEMPRKFKLSSTAFTRSVRALANALPHNTKKGFAISFVEISDLRTIHAWHVRM